MSQCTNHALTPTRISRSNLSRRKFLLVPAASLLSSCAPRGLISFSTDTENGSIQRIWVVASGGTVQVPVHNIAQSGGEAFGLYERFDISIPATHEVGQIEWPNSFAGPKDGFFVNSRDGFPDPGGLIDDIVRNLAPGQEVGIFVHGFNTSYPEAVYRHAQIAHDYAFGGPQITFVWPSEAKLLEYVADRDSVLIARKALRQFLSRITTRLPGRVTLAAHSMGALLAMEALRETDTDRPALVDRLAGLILISPDIGMGVFRSQVAAIGTLPSQTIVILSQDDRPLHWSQALAGGRPRLGEGQDIAKLESLGIVAIDLSGVGDGDPRNHLTAMTSPTAISFLRAMIEDEKVFTT